MSEYWDEQFGDKPQVNVSEGYDQTWPFNFKWAYNGETGQADVWRVQGGIDGRPTHRAEVAARWGRDPRVQDGDVMGLATYTPPEKKFTGEVVAPADLRIQTYYNQPTPPAITEWFEQNFPTASVRDAVIVRPRLGRTAEWNPADTYEPEGPIYKWVWNERKGLLMWQTSDVDGEPWHDHKAMTEWGRFTSPGFEGDILGYAFPGDPKPGVVSVESYDNDAIPPKAFAAVKSQLSEWFPHDQVIGDTTEKHEFAGDPADFHSAAVQWAWDNLAEPSVPSAQNGLDASRGVWGGLTRLFRKKPVWGEKTADADMEGCMVALYVPEEAGRKLKIRGGEPVEQMHITLLYFADKQADRDDWDEVERLVKQIASQSPPLSGTVSGYGVFNSDEGDVLWASPSVVGLAELRHKIYEACEDAGFHVNEEHDWVPHITLKYDHKGKLPKVDDVSLDFTSLSFAKGDEHTDFDFKGHLEKTTKFRRLSAQRLGFIKIAPDINELAQRAIDNLMNREDLVAMSARYIDPQGKPVTVMPDTGGVPVATWMAQNGYTENPKANPALWQAIRNILAQLPPEIFKFYPWVVKQIKKNWSPQGPSNYPWGSVGHLRDILTQAFQHMEYLRSQPPNSPNAGQLPDINQLDFPALEQWVYQRNATGIDVRPGTQWEYQPNTQNYKEWADANRPEEANVIPWNDKGPYIHAPQQKVWELSNGWSVWPVWSENDLKQEGDLMGHCVGGYCRNVQAGHSVIFSLRDPKGEPHATIELDPNGYGGPNAAGATQFSIVQIQGKQNSEPADEYKAMIREFFQTLMAEGYDLTQRIDITSANDLEEYEYLSAPNEAYGVPIEKNIDEVSIARDLVEQAADGYSYSAQDALENLISEGVIDGNTMADAIRYEADDAIEQKERDLQYEWEYYERPRLEQEYEDEKAAAAPEEVWNEETEEYETEEEDEDFPSFEEWLEQNHPDDYNKEVYGFEQEAEDEMSEVVDLRYRFSSTRKTAATFKPGDLVARAQDPEGKWIKPAYGEVKRVYRDPINREWSAVVRWDYPENPDGFVETALPFSNIVPFQWQMGLDLRTASAPTEPPNYRKHEKPDEACKLCKMMWKGECWGYGNKPVEPDMVCDSFSPETVKTSAEDYLDWGGWDGAHRFVTDGKEILTDPETENIDPKQWRVPELEEKFRTIYPEAKGLAGGWVIPTADGLGIGIYAPAAGHGDSNEPGLHDIIGAIEKEFGKPAHVITNPDLLSDEKAYQPIKSMEWQEI